MGQRFCGVLLMSFMQAATMLADVAKGQTVYVYTHPEVLDFTVAGKAELVICGQEGTEVRLGFDKDNVLVVWTMLQASVFGPGRKLIGWNLKNLFSYLRYHGSKDFKVEAALIDLKIIESYLGLSKPVPES